MKRLLLVISAASILAGAGTADALNRTATGAAAGAVGGAVVAGPVGAVVGGVGGAVIGHHAQRHARGYSYRRCRDANGRSYRCRVYNHRR